MNGSALSMTVPVWVLLTFALWTLLLLALTVGVYRWGRILTGRGRLSDYGGPPVVEGDAFYPRAMRAHANCLENLPVYASIVLVAVVAGTRGAALDALALTVMGGRIAQSTVHLAFTQTGTVVFFRSMFFNVQWAAMVGMGVLVLRDALPG